MPSPFPGMDPFIESQDWEDFHANMITTMQSLIIAQVRPKYTVKSERRVYLEQGSGGLPKTFIADAAIYETQLASNWSHEPTSEGGVAVADPVEPMAATVPMPQEQREPRLLLRRASDQQIITVIELLSPTNKKPAATGAEVYREKRIEILQTRVHLVELDLLRGGQRPPLLPRPRSDYFAMVSRGNRRPNVDVYAWSLWHRLPTIPIPLDGDDPDVTLDLQTAFETTYDRAGYDYSIRYDEAIAPPLSEPDVQRWRAIAAS